MAFNLSKFGAGLGAAAKPLDPAADIARLLNQHTHHWMSLEKEIKEVKAKQEGAQAAYAAALEAREAARSALVDAERGLAEAEAAGTHARAELDSSKAANAKLEEEVAAVRREVEGVTALADTARLEFRDRVAALVQELKLLQAAHPDRFLCPVEL